METERTRLFVNDFVANLTFSNYAFQLMLYTTMSMDSLGLNYIGKCTFMGPGMASLPFLPRDTSQWVTGNILHVNGIVYLLEIHTDIYRWNDVYQNNIGERRWDKTRNK